MVDSEKKSSSKKKSANKKSSGIAKSAGSVVKPVNKKVANKKSSGKSSKSLVKRDAPEDKLFFLVNGHKLRNIKELADVLADLEDWVFNHHVTPDKNDFAAWVEHVFEDIELAKKIAGVKDKDKMQLVLYKHLTHKLW